MHMFFSTHNIHYGPNLSLKFHLNRMINAEGIQLTMLRTKRKRHASALCVYELKSS